MAYKVVNFAGEAIIMSAQELCDDAQDRPKVMIGLKPEAPPGLGDGVESQEAGAGGLRRPLPRQAVWISGRLCVAGRIVLGQF
jgi:hypothetical protein